MNSNTSALPSAPQDNLAIASRQMIRRLYRVSMQSSLQAYRAVPRKVRRLYARRMASIGYRQQQTNLPPELWKAKQLERQLAPWISSEKS